MPKRSRDDEDESTDAVDALLSDTTTKQIVRILEKDLLWPLEKDATGVEIELREDASLPIDRVGRLLAVAGVKDGIFVQRPNSIRIRLVADYDDDAVAKRVRVDADHVVGLAAKVTEPEFDAMMTRDMPNASRVVRLVVKAARAKLSVSRVTHNADTNFVFLHCRELSLMDVAQFHRENRAPIVGLSVWPGNKLVVRVIPDGVTTA